MSGLPPKDAPLLQRAGSNSGLPSRRRRYGKGIPLFPIILVGLAVAIAAFAMLTGVFG